jgi:hypothetical protein
LSSVATPKAILPFFPGHPSAGAGGNTYDVDCRIEIGAACVVWREHAAPDRRLQLGAIYTKTVGLADVSEMRR